MAITVDIPGIGKTQFDNEEQANAFFNSQIKNEEMPIAEPEAQAKPKQSFLEKMLTNSQGQPPMKATQPLWDRFVASFGNMEKRQPIPDSLKGIEAITDFAAPGKGALGELITGKKAASIGDILQMSANIPANLVELPADLLNMIPTGTRARQGIGTAIGNYTAPKGQEDYLHNKEALTNDLISVLALLGPEIVAGGQKAYSGVKALVNNGISKTESGFMGDIARASSDLGQKTVENIPILGSALKERRLAKFDQNLESVGPSVTNSKEFAGLDAGEKIGQINKNASEAYQDFSGKLLNRFGDSKQSYESVRKLLSEKIDAIPENLAAGSNEARHFKNQLIQLRDSIKGNPTIAEMDQFTKYFGDKANFKSNARNAEERLYGDLYRASRQDLINGYESAVVQVAEKSKPFKEAVKTKDVLLDEQNDLADAAKRNPLWVEGKKFPFLPSGYQESTKVIQPNWAKRTGAEKVVAQQEENALKLTDINALIEQLNSKNSNIAEAAKNEILRRRTEISKMIDVKEGPVGKLSNLMPGEVVDRAVSTGKLNRNIGGLDEVLSANPEYREPLRNIVLASIKDKAKDPNGLKKIITQYQDVIPSLLNPEEITSLQKLAGTYRRPIMKADPMANTSDISVNLRAELPFLQQLLLNKSSQQ